MRASQEFRLNVYTPLSPRRDRYPALDSGVDIIKVKDLLGRRHVTAKFSTELLITFHFWRVGVGLAGGSRLQRVKMK